MTAQPVNISEIWREALMLGRQHSSVLIAAILFITATSFAFEWIQLVARDPSGSIVLIGILNLGISIGAQYLLIERLLLDRRVIDGGGATRLYMSMLGALMFSGVAIAAGMIALIVPGIYLAGRWLTAAPRVVESRMAAMQALRTSWEDSEASQLAFCLAVMLAFTPALILLGGYAAGDPFLIFASTLPGALAINALSTIIGVLGWVISTAAYRLAVPVGGEFEQVFS